MRIALALSVASIAIYSLVGCAVAAAIWLYAERCERMITVRQQLDYKGLPGFDAMCLAPWHWHRWTVAQWRAWRAA